MSISKVFGENLRTLCSRKPSIASVARDLGINKVQFNRYLTGQSFPKPPVLQQICLYFQVDARILLDPLDVVEDKLSAAQMPSELSSDVPKELMPDGFYRVSLVSAHLPDRVAREVRLIRREAGGKMAHWRCPRRISEVLHGGYENARPRQNSQLFRLGNNLFMIASDKITGSVCFEFWTPSFSMGRQIWGGFAAFATRETLTASRAVRGIIEPIAPDCGAVLAAERATGYLRYSELDPYEQHLLSPDQPFR